MCSSYWEQRVKESGEERAVIIILKLIKVAVLTITVKSRIWKKSWNILDLFIFFWLCIFVIILVGN